MRLYYNTDYPLTTTPIEEPEPSVQDQTFTLLRTLTKPLHSSPLFRSTKNPLNRWLDIRYKAPRATFKPPPAPLHHHFDPPVSSIPIPTSAIITTTAVPTTQVSALPYHIRTPFSTLLTHPTAIPALCTPHLHILSCCRSLVKTCPSLCTPLCLSPLRITTRPSGLLVDEEFRCLACLIKQSRHVMMQLLQRKGDGKQVTLGLVLGDDGASVLAEREGNWKRRGAMTRDGKKMTEMVVVAAGRRNGAGVMVGEEMGEEVLKCVWEIYERMGRRGFRLWARNRKRVERREKQKADKDERKGEKNEQREDIRRQERDTNMEERARKRGRMALDE